MKKFLAHEALLKIVFALSYNLILQKSFGKKSPAFFPSEVDSSGCYKAGYSTLL